MKRRPIDSIFSLGFFVAAALLIAVGYVMSGHATYTDHYIGHYLGQQKIAFPPKDKLTTEELASPCVAANAGKLVQTAAQARCYGEQYVGALLATVGEGNTYAELGARQVGLRSELAALPLGSPAAPALKAELDTANTQREVLFKGETLRGQLLNMDILDEIGSRARAIGTVAYAAAALLTLLAIASVARQAAASEGDEVVTAQPASPAVKPRRHRAAA
ncbi:MAG: hypothetical protein QOI61_320 [Actinomycetota bacterium]|jgi:hypothetical protein